MTIRYLLDTMIVSSPASKLPTAEIVKQLARHGHESAVAAPAWHELTCGCRRLPLGRRRSALETYLRDVVHACFPILPYEEIAASWHGRERARLEGLGKTAPYVDGQVAAIAQVNGLVLVTLDAKAFVAFDGITIESWVRRGRR